MPCWTLSLPVLENDQNLIDSYLSKAGVSKTVEKGGVWWLAGESVKRHRLLYCKTTEGDCGTIAAPNFTAAKATGIAGQLLGSPVGGNEDSSGSGTVSSTLTGALLGTSAAASFATFGLSLIPGLLAGLFAHHAQAVAQEQNVLCDVSTKYNAYAQAIEQALQSGQMSLAQAQALSAGVAQELQKEIAEGYKDCNAYCYYKSSLAATELFAREVVYPRMSQSLGGALNTLTEPGNLALLAAAAIGAKLLFF